MNRFAVEPLRLRLRGRDSYQACSPGLRPGIRLSQRLGICPEFPCVLLCVLHVPSPAPCREPHRPDSTPDPAPRREPSAATSGQSTARRPCPDPPGHTKNKTKNQPPPKSSLVLGGSFHCRLCVVAPPDVPSVPPRRPHARLHCQLPADEARVVTNLPPTRRPAHRTPRPVACVDRPRVLAKRLSLAKRLNLPPPPTLP